MAAVRERVDVDPERAWLGGVAAGVLVLVAGALAFPRAVYDRFIWKYFWGPVYADAKGAECAWLSGGTPTTGAGSACTAHPETVAYPGYTVVSEVGYAVLILVAIAGLALLLRRLDLEHPRRLLYGLFPLMPFGGALRTVEDANNRIAESAAGGPIPYPVNTLFISPLIYVTVAALALAALLGSLYLERTGRVERYDYPLAAAGAALTLVTLGLLGWMALTTETVRFYPSVLVVVLGLSLAATAAVWVGIERLAPEINAGTGGMGLLVLVGQAVDGAANVVGLDWYTALTGRPNLVPKHPVNRAVVSVTDSTLPASVTAVVGDAWPFLLLKLAFAVFVVWVFEAEVIEESPRFSVMLLIGAVAVGIGPGTRDMLRAVFGV